MTRLQAVRSRLSHHGLHVEISRPGDGRARYTVRTQDNARAGYCVGLRELESFEEGYSAAIRATERAREGTQVVRDVRADIG